MIPNLAAAPQENKDEVFKENKAKYFSIAFLFLFVFVFKLVCIFQLLFMIKF
jgi:hypothetical protein